MKTFSVISAACKSQRRKSRKLPSLVLTVLGLIAAGTASAQSYRYAGQFGTSGSGTLNAPNDVHIDPNSRNIVVTDAGNNRIVIYNFAGSYQSAFGSMGTDNGQFEYPAGVGIDPSTRNIFVADYYNNRVQVFSSSGSYLSQIDNIPTACGVAIYPGTRDILVSEGYGAAVLIYGPSETYASAFGDSSNFGYACSLAIASNGDILVADQTNNDVQVFNSSGTLQRAFGGSGSGDGQFLTPSPGGIAIDPSTGNIVVADYGNNRVEVFDSNGNYLSQFGGAGTGPGQFNGPTGVAVDPATYNVLVTDRGNSRVQEFSPCGPTQVDLSILPSTASVNQQILFSAQVGISQPFGGAVSFLVDGNGAVCSAPVGDVDGSCTALATLGTHTVVAQYSGNGFNPPGCSAAGSVTVITDTTPVQTTVTLVGPPNGLDQDEDMTLDATVSTDPMRPSNTTAAGNTSAASLDGFVTFYDGTTALGYVTLTSNQATYSNKLAAGTHSFSAVYSGDSQNATSTGSVSITVSKPSDDIFYNGLEVPPGG